MSFLQINNPDGTSGIKRPFHLSDIQAIWDGITSLFKPIKGEDFRIISGFELDGTTYSAGAVYYNGNMYEYDTLKPITPTTPEVYFAKIGVEPRQFEGGDSYPFAFKYVCGGSSFASESGYVSQLSSTSFVANISKYKSYLGERSVVENNLANSSVSTSKLQYAAVTSEKIAYEAVRAYNLQAGQRSLPSLNRADNVEVIESGSRPIDRIINQSGFTPQINLIGGNLTIPCPVDNVLNYPPIIHLIARNTSSSTRRIVLYPESDAAPTEVEIPANKTVLMLLCSVGTELDGYAGTYHLALTKVL